MNVSPTAASFVLINCHRCIILYAFFGNSNNNSAAFETFFNDDKTRALVKATHIAAQRKRCNKLMTQKCL
jgi:hypothetical protein